MDLVRLLSKLQSIAIGGVTEAKEKADKDYDHDGKVESPEEEHAGSVDNAIKKSKANEDIANVLRGLQAIQEGDDACPECGKVHEGECEAEKIDECGEMELSPLTVTDVTGGEENQLASMPQIEIQPEQPGQEPEMAQQVEAQPEKAMYTLSITNGENNLSMTTDVPDEIIHVMKMAGIQGKAEVKPKAPSQDSEQSDDNSKEQGEEKEVDEAWGNTPSATNEKDPKTFGDIRDWGMKGTGAGATNSASKKPFGSGDNPLSEAAMMNEYKSFKAGK